MMNYILLVRPFPVSGVATITPSQSITLHLLIPLQAPLNQSQETDEIGPYPTHESDYESDWDL